MTFVNYPIEPLRQALENGQSELSDLKKCTNDSDCTTIVIDSKTLTGRKCINGVCSCPFSYGGDDCTMDTCGLTTQDGGCVDSTVGTCELQDDGSHKCVCVVSRSGAICQLCNKATQNVSGLLCVHSNCVYNSTACSGHGICYATRDNAMCQCFPGYNGNYCEINACDVYIAPDNTIHYCKDYGICEYKKVVLSDKSVSNMYSCSCFPGVSGDKCQVVSNYSQQIVVFTVVVIVEIVALVILLVLLVLRIKKSKRAEVLETDEMTIN
ncbi:Neurogenic locus notch-like protein [Giardia lamblia P15]|uniref:Neurogenic locus notch-like protein n=1 Tax=Giardia intestinalis (strain P15) TaxID=658858 RepID=E1F1U6_GIAIA|nr:Neurogenic locus notch-like protein [Giardia lamblia P15]